MELLVNNLQEKFQVEDDLLGLAEKVVKETLEAEESDPEVEVSLVFVDNDYIRELNREYRNIDKATDVLSFPLLEETAEPGFENPGEQALGDIIISLERAQEQAEEYNHPFEREVAFLIVHGMLHLLGYDHMEEEERVVMREHEERVLSRLNLSR